MTFAEEALRYSPFDLLVFLAHLGRGVASIQLGLYAEGAAHLENTIEANPTLNSFQFFAACAHALAGEHDRGQALAKEGLKVEPDFRLNFFMMSWCPMLPNASLKVVACWAYPNSLRSGITV